VPVGRGGTLVKPEWGGPEAAPKQARTDFQIFFQERFDDVLTASPVMFGGASDRKAMLAAASIYWRENLSQEERAAYHARALAEKQTQAEQIAEVRVVLGSVGRSGRHWLAFGWSFPPYSWAAAACQPASSPITQHPPLPLPPLPCLPAGGAG
jgi:hypothetical protein